MHLNQVRQIAYQGVAVGVGVGVTLQQRRLQAVGDLWHSKSTGLRGHGESGGGRKQHSDGTELTELGVRVCVNLSRPPPMMHVCGDINITDATMTFLILPSISWQKILSCTS